MPAIGKEIAGELAKALNLAENPDFVGTRKGLPDPKSLPLEELAKLIQEKPEYGRIVCRCEQVSEGEILDAIRRPLGARSLDGVKRRAGSGMGRWLSQDLAACGAKLTKLTKRQADYIGVDVKGPYKPDYYRY